MAATSVTLDGEWNAETLTGANGDPVASWPDDSGNGYDAATGAFNSASTLKTAAINGKQAVNFDRDASPLQGLTASLPTNPTVPITLVAIAASSTIGAYPQTLLGAQAEWPYGFSMGFQEYGNTSWGMMLEGDTCSASPGPPDTDWHVYITVWDGTTTTAYLDGVQVAQGAPTGTPNNGTSSLFCIGAWSSSGMTRDGWEGDIAYAAVAKRALTDTEMGAIESYANSTYGITVTPRSGAGVSGTGSITATSTVASTGRKAALGAAAVAAVAALSGSGVAAEPHAGTGEISASASLTGTGQKNASSDGDLVWYASLTGSGTASQQASGTGEITGSVSVTGDGSKHASGSTALSVSASVSGSGQKNATGTSTVTVSVTLTGQGEGSQTQAASGTGSIATAYQALAAGRKHAAGAASITTTAALTGRGFSHRPTPAKHPRASITPNPFTAEITT